MRTSEYFSSENDNCLRPGLLVRHTQIFSELILGRDNSVVGRRTYLPSINLIDVKDRRSVGSNERYFFESIQGRWDLTIGTYADGLEYVRDANGIAVVRLFGGNTKATVGLVFPVLDEDCSGLKQTQHVEMSLSTYCRPEQDISCLYEGMQNLGQVYSGETGSYQVSGGETLVPYLILDRLALDRNYDASTPDDWPRRIIPRACDLPQPHLTFEDATVVSALLKAGIIPLTASPAIPLFPEWIGGKA